MVSITFDNECLRFKLVYRMPQGKFPKTGKIIYCYHNYYNIVHMWAMQHKNEVFFGATYFEVQVQLVLSSKFTFAIINVQVSRR